MVRFGSAHIPQLDGGFLKPETLEPMFTPRSSQGSVVGYGLGWMSARDLQLRRTCFHFGAESGGSSVLAIYPEQQVSIAVIGNLGHARHGLSRLLGIANPFLSDPAAYIITESPNYPSGFDHGASREKLRTSVQAGISARKER